jgi:hypothetical protein
MPFVRRDIVKMIVPTQSALFRSDTRGGLYNNPVFKSNLIEYTGYKDLYRDATWKLKIGKGIDASQPFAYKAVVDVKKPRVHAPFVWTDIYSDPAAAHGTYVSTLSNIMTNFPAFLPHDAALSDLALLRLKKRLNSSINRKNQLIPLVELRELRDLIRVLVNESLSLAVNLLRLYSRGKRKSSYHYIREQAQRLWLTYSFALGPTFGAVSDLLEQLSDFYTADKHRESIRLRGSARSSWNQSFDVSLGDSFYAWDLRAKRYLNHSLSYRWVAGFDLSILSSNNYGLIDQFQFHARDLPSVGWELTPFSWMFDYFTNISQVLDDTFVAPAGMTKYVTRTAFYECVANELPSLVFVPTLGLKSKCNVTGTFKPGRARYVMVERSVHAALPRVGFHLKTADQISTNALSKLLNVCSLIKSGRTPIDILRKST